MKILILTGNFSPDIGGPARMLDHLISDLLKRNFKVTVLTSAPQDNLPRDYRVYRVSRKLFKPLRFLLSLIYGAILSLQTDILYVADIYSAGAACWAKKIFNKKMVIRFVSDPVWDTARSQGWFEDSFSEFQDKIYSPKIEKLKTRRNNILHSADKIITCSNFLKNHLIKIGVPESKIKVIYNSVEKLNFQPSKTPVQVKQELKIKGPLLFTNPRLVPWKSVEVLIRIISRGVLHAPKPTSLIILGEGSEEKKIKDLIQELNLADRVFLLGKKLGQEFVNYFNAADIFVYNTSYEGMSHAILDAMQLGKPIITTNIAANIEILTDQEDALLVDYDNPDQWQTAIQKLLDNPGLGQQMVKNYQAKMDRFKWDRLVEETIAALNNV